MRVLDAVHTPAELRMLDQMQLRQLAEEIREFLVSAVCHTGGHLGPNLGIVELTLALHRVFESPDHPLVFDTGHQAYVHKIITGRRDGFSRLRATGGLSGYPNRGESLHDFVENSHASTALSYADGLAKAFERAGTPRRPVVAVVGDGALTGGMAWEALNNLGSSGRHVVVVVNDNGRSYSPTVGGLPRHLDRLYERAGFERVVAQLGGDDLGPAPTTLPGTVFGALGLEYVGPVDGHDLTALDQALTRARDATGPIVVHCRTRKGAGYEPALSDQADHLHTVGVVDHATGRPSRPPARTWTDAFADRLVEIGARRADVVAVSGAMLGPTGLQRFAERYPGRCFDVGIAEQHAMTSAAGLAMGGAHPVLAMYATFANRAFDQALLDVGLHRLPVTLVLDRAGITGPDGASHHGMWDLAMLGIVPGMRVSAPRDANSLVEQLTEAVDSSDGPTAVRFPKARLEGELPAVERLHGIDLLRRPARPNVLLLGVGALAGAAVDAAEALTEHGVECTVADPRWVLPANPALVPLAAAHRLVVTVEDGLRDGGVGQRVAALLGQHAGAPPVVSLGLPSAYIPHGTRAELLARYGLDGPGVAKTVRAIYDERWPTCPALRVVPSRTRQVVGK